MNLLLLKQGGVIALVSVNLVLLVWAVAAHRQKRPLPDGYYKLLPVSSLVATFQVGMGLSFLLAGKQAHPMHIFYGTLVATGALLQFLVRPTAPAGQKYKARPLIHAALALFVALLAIRSWMSG